MGEYGLTERTFYIPAGAAEGGISSQARVEEERSVLGEEGFHPLRFRCLLHHSTATVIILGLD